VLGKDAKKARGLDAQVYPILFVNVAHGEHRRRTLFGSKGETFDFIIEIKIRTSVEQICFSWY
jgi:hypothetical protein